MSHPEAIEGVEEFTRIESIYVRHRNALLVRGKFAPIYTDYYLHLMQHGLRHHAELDQMLKDLLAGLALHLVARPWAETIAWTVTLTPGDPLVVAPGGGGEEPIGTGMFCGMNTICPPAWTAVSPMVKNAESLTNTVDVCPLNRVIFGACITFTRRSPWAASMNMYTWMSLRNASPTPSPPFKVGDMVPW